MTVAVERLLDQIKVSPPEDLREVCHQLISLAGHLEYRELSGAAITHFAAEIFAMLDREEADRCPSQQSSTTRTRRPPRPVFLRVPRALRGGSRVAQMADQSAPIKTSRLEIKA
jgi:hypothetical protein